MFGSIFLVLLNDDSVDTPDDPNVMRAPIGNNGTADIIVGQATLTGDSEFTIDADPVSNTTLEPGTQRNIKIRLDTDTPGTYTGYLHVPSSDPDGTLVIPLLGIVLAALVPGISVDPLSIAFGSIDTATGTVSALVTVSSTGTASLIVGTTVIAGSGFTKSSDGATGVTIPAGESRSITVTFNPSSDGAKTGTLTIPSNAGASIVVSLTGTGTTGAPAPEPTLVNRFYLGRQASPVAAIANDTSVWANQTTDAQFLMSTSKAGPVVALGQTVDWHFPSGTQVRLARWVSPPLEAQTVDTTFLCYIIGHRSAQLGANVSSAIRFGIYHSGTMTWQPVKALSAVASPWGDSSAPGPRRFPAGTPLSWHFAGTFLSGDRLVVEAGARCFNGADIGGIRIRYGGTSSDTDLAATENPPAVDLTKAPWIEFTDGLLVSP